MLLSSSVRSDFSFVGIPEEKDLLALHMNSLGRKGVGALGAAVLLLYLEQIISALSLALSVGVSHWYIF